MHSVMHLRGVFLLINLESVPVNRLAELPQVMEDLILGIRSQLGRLLAVQQTQINQLLLLLQGVKRQMNVTPLLIVVMDSIVITIPVVVFRIQNGLLDCEFAI